MPLFSLRNWLVNEGSIRIFFLLYFIAMMGFFAWGFHKYYFHGRFANVADMLSWGLPIAKGSAYAAKFNLFFIFLPVCRTCITFTRFILGKIVPIDKNITFHKWVGYFMLFFGWTHAVAHLYNVSVLQKKTEKTGISILISVMVCYFFRAWIYRSINVHLLFFNGYFSC